MPPISRHSADPKVKYVSFHAPFDFKASVTRLRDYAIMALWPFTETVSFIVILVHCYVRICMWNNEWIKLSQYRFAKIQPIISSLYIEQFLVTADSFMATA